MSASSPGAAAMEARSRGELALLRLDLAPTGLTIKRDWVGRSSRFDSGKRYDGSDIEIVGIAERKECAHHIVAALRLAERIAVNGFCFYERRRDGLSRREQALDWIGHIV